MITAVDTNVLLDVFSADPAFGDRSAAAIRACLDGGGLLACPLVWAETGSFFESAEAMEWAMSQLRVDFSPLDQSTSAMASSGWRAYRRAGGSRDRVIADFLIGAHALVRADRLLTRDRGFYRRYFAELEVVDPSAPR